MDLPTTRYDKPAETKGPVTSEAAPIVAAGNGMLRRISFYIFLVTIFLAPLVFVPSAYAPLDFVKAAFLSLGVLVSAILYVIGGIKKPTVTFPRSILGYVALGIVVSLFISALQSTHVAKSFFGQGFEMGTVSFLLIMILAAYLASRLVLRDKESVFKIYTAFFVSFIVLALFHIIRLVGGADVLSFGVLEAVSATFAGKWYDFALITAAAGVLSLITLKFLPLRGLLRGVIYAALIISGALLFLINAMFIWVTVALVMLGIGIYEFTTRTPKGEGMKKVLSRISLLTFIVFVVAAALAWKGNVIAFPVVEKINAEYVEAVLPWQYTLDITSNTLKESPFFGAGPNRFAQQYLKYKPLDINQSAFWNAEFTNGFGLIPSFATTQGLLGILVWCAFLVFFVREGIRAFRKTIDPLAKFLLSSSFFVSLLLWIGAIVYVPSHATLFLTFIFTGIFIGVLVRERQIEEKVVVATPGVRYGKMVLAAFSIGAILLIVWLGVYTKQAIALTFFQKGIKELNVNNSPDSADKYFKKALVWNDSDIYYQALAEINIIKINTLVQEVFAAASANTTPDPLKVEQIQTLIKDALAHARSDQAIDPTNHYNYISEARIAEVGATLKLENAYENAKVAYQRALQINPYNPSIYLGLARLEASQGKVNEAQQFIGSALNLKRNYVEAVFYLSQLQVANNQLRDALTSTKVAIQLTPNEPLLHFQLGLLEYNDKNYQAAATAFEKAVGLFSDYANARYFLGLSYARLGNNEKAIAQFAELKKTNPDNQEVDFILTNLEEGKSPFADAKPPIDNTPEKRSTLPVTETNGKEVI